MTELALRKRKGAEASVKRLMARSDELEEAVRLRAFEVFQRRGNPGWSETVDWMIAEREVLSHAAARLVEDESGFRLSLALPGAAPKDVAVTVLPQAVIVEAKAAKRPSKSSGIVHFCEFAGNGVFRRVDLPAPCDSGAAEAALENGVLVVRAPRAAEDPVPEVSGGGRNGLPARTAAKRRGVAAGGRTRVKRNPKA